MKLLTISNTLNLLVQSSNYFQSYHAGYHGDINRDIVNNFNPDGNTGKHYPLVLWAVPIDGSLKLQDKGGTSEIEMELYFYGLQDYNNNGDPSAMNQTMMTVWDELHSRAAEFLHAFRKSGPWSIRDNNVKLFTDANLQVDRLVCVGVTLTLSMPYACADYQGEEPLEALNYSTTPVESSTDLETT